MTNNKLGFPRPVKLTDSKTYRSMADAIGICSSCKEHTSVLSPCCGDLVYFEGGMESADDLVSDISYELGISENEILDALN